MAEWHITPDYIVNNWTDELFQLMLEKLVDRKQRESKAMRGDSGKVTDTALFSKASNLIKVEHGS